MSDESFNWIDDELRRVPLPEGLLARLRRLGKEITELSDQDLDVALISVPVPQHLEQRLLSIVEDEQLDEHLREIEVPAGLLEAIAYVPQDELLRDVVVPVDLMLQLRRIPPRRRRRIPTAQLALAASLLLLISMGYVLSMAGLVLTAYDRIPEPYALFTIDPSPVELVADVHYEEALAWEPIAQPGVSLATSPILFDPLQQGVNIQPVKDALRAKVPEGYDIDDDLTPIAFGILGQQPYTADDQTPDLEVVTAPEQRGLDSPIALGFDRQFLITEGTNPIVPVGRIPSGPLRRNRLPLWTQTGSYDRLRRESLQYGLPSPRQIHVEDLLAAMDYQYAPAPPGQLRIRAAAGPSVFGEQQAQLLQIGVQAGLPMKYRSASSHVTLALDVSDSMRWSNRLETVRAAVREFARLLRPVDRVSLVIFNEDAYAVLEDVPGDDSQLLVAALEGLSADGGTNALAGLQLAASLAKSPATLDCQRRHLVVISDGMPRLPSASTAGIEHLFDNLTQHGTVLHVVAMHESVDESDGLQALATLTGNTLVTCQDEVTLCRFLSMNLLGVSPEVARDASLTIEFNHKAVDSYRLLGHEATAAGGPLSSDAHSTLLAGQSGTALYEIWFKPDAPTLVATATVVWKDANGKRRSERQEVHQIQFRTSWAEMALSLQAAAIAAEAAEVLRQSPFCSVRNRDLREVLAQAEEVNPRLGERASYQRFIDVLKQTEAVRRGLELPER